ncbi:Histone-lysine N-methyltransferase SETMAR [Folsomia candida]|uniref:Histone-lysine N-methyltransferase SETMAR n=1 Tax=Folsomia candida TaxID=158441 RepID=A0A226DU23_FOLCA|nr:Histone-lysine N-methyltransferase SETMAR [Folsomia candida]
MRSVKITLILIVLTAVMAPVLCQAEGEACTLFGLPAALFECKSECDMLEPAPIERLRKLEEQIMRDPRLKLSYLADEMGVSKPAICSMLTEDLDDNAPLHTWLFARVSADENRFTCTNHTPCSPDLTLSDYYSFRNLKKNIRGKRFSDDNEIKS